MIDNEGGTTPIQTEVPQPSEIPQEEKPVGIAAPPEVQQVLNALPPEQRHILERSFAMLVQGPLMNPIAAKIDKVHLNKIFDGVENDNLRSPPWLPPQPLGILPRLTLPETACTPRRNCAAPTI